MLQYKLTGLFADQRLPDLVWWKKFYQGTIRATIYDKVTACWPRPCLNLGTSTLVLTKAISELFLRFSVEKEDLDVDGLACYTSKSLINNLI